ncbi:MAG: ATP-binding cassette domain-containing protein [Desulfovibrionales bacterium]|nr:ATP-binding cassette domain-containing protein [Desulfovibrionales bacterium]
MIDVQNLGMQFGPVTALEDATFRVGQGEILGLLGPNGAGKSTVMKILTTYLRPSAGSATVCGFDVVQEPREVRRRIGYLPENLPLYLYMEVGEYLDFVARARGLKSDMLRQRLEWVLVRTGLIPVFRRPIGELSKGFRQRTALAQALIHDPEVIILDEPTTGLDPHQILEIRGLIRELAATKTVLFSTHILHEAETIADRIVIISHGTIRAQGTLGELAARAGTRTWGLAEIKAPVAEIRVALEAMRDIVAVHPEREGGGWTAIRFAVLDPMTSLENVSALCAARSWPLRGLTLTGQSLEDIFLALTRAEQAA